MSDSDVNRNNDKDKSFLEEFPQDDDFLNEEIPPLIYDEKDLPPPNEEEPPWGGLESELPKIETQAYTTKEYDKFTNDLEKEIKNDIGFAGKPETIHKLAYMYKEDRSNYLRCEDILRKYKLAGECKKFIKKTASKIKPVTEDSFASVTSLMRVKKQFKNAPILDNALIPAKWHLNGRKGKDEQTYGLIKEVVKKVGEDYVTTFVPIAWEPIVITSNLINKTTNETKVEIAWKYNKRWVKKCVSRSDLLDRGPLLREIGDTEGFPVNTNNAKEVIEYLLDYEHANQYILPSRPMSTQMGWYSLNGEKVFILGKKTISETQETKIKLVGEDKGEEQIFRSIKKHGKLDKWLEAAKIAAEYPLVKLGLYASLTSPLLNVLNTPGFVVDWAYKTSSGKTTLLSIAASIWGSPSIDGDDSLIISWDTTTVGLERRAAALNSIPLFLDDTKRARAYGKKSVVPEIIYEITNGQGRARGSKGGIRNTDRWRTVALSTGESRVIDFDKSGGTAARTLNIWGSPFENINASEDINKINSLIKDNYGHAGELLVKWLVNNKDKKDYLWDMFRNNTREINDRLSNIANEGNTIKFINGYNDNIDFGVLNRIAKNLAVISVAAYCAHQAIDLPFERGDFIEHVLKSLISGAEATNREREAMEDVLTWAQENPDKFYCNDIHYESDTPTQGWIGYWNLQAPKSWNKIGFYSNRLDEFLKKKGYEPFSIKKQWKERKWIETNGGRLTKRVRVGKYLHSLLIIPRDTYEYFIGDSDSDDDQPTQKENQSTQAELDLLEDVPF